MKVILISGKAQNGKDTTAMLLEKHLTNKSSKVLITHYGDLVKYICTMFFSWDGKKDEAGRQLLQYVGTDIVRAREPNYWANFVYGIVDMFKSNWDYVLIPDARFPNEIDIFKNRVKDTVHIRVDRGDFDNGLTEEQKVHPSETSLDNTTPDYLLHNTGSLAELEYNIIKLVEENNI